LKFVLPNLRYCIDSALTLMQKGCNDELQPLHSGASGRISNA